MTTLPNIPTPMPSIGVAGTIPADLPAPVRRNWYQVAADVLSITNQTLGAVGASSSAALGMSPRGMAGVLIAMVAVGATQKVLSGYAKQQAIADAPNDPD